MIGNMLDGWCKLKQETINKLEANLDQAGKNFWNFFNTITELLFILDMEGNILHVNNTVEKRLGYSLQELRNESVLKVHPKDRWDEAHLNVVEMLQQKREFCPIPLQTKTGELIPVETRVSMGQWDGREVLYGVSKDISDLQLSEEKFSKAFNITPSLMALSSLEDDKIIEVNQTYCDVLGLKKENVIGKTSYELGIFINPEDRVRALVQTRTGANLKNLEVEVKGKNGVRHVGLFSASEIHIGDKKVLLTTMNDITELKQMEKEIKKYNAALEELVTQKIQKIEYLNLHDDVTGLGNHHALDLKFETQSKDNYTLGNKSAIYIKIDNYRYITDAMGFKNSTNLLRDLAQKMQTAVGRWGELYRMGIDEFVAIINSNSADFVVELSRKIRKAVTQKIVLYERKFDLTVSVGVGIGQLEDNLATAVKKASIAIDFPMKEESGLSIYTSELETAKHREMQLEEDLKYALAQGELELYFQPIYDIKRGTINHAEALLRWNHHSLGIISPLEFIPIAEKTKEIIPITEWIVSDVLEKISVWNKSGLDNLAVSINLSKISLEKRSDEFVARLSQQLQESGVLPSRIIFEITESTLLEDKDDVINASQLLRGIGVKLALDDFGTGYSSFASLQDYPLDIAKLDQSFIRSIETSARKQLVVESMISIMHALGLDVVIEGVETKEQFDYLVNIGSDYIQGYLFSKPLANAEFMDYYLNINPTDCLNTTKSIKRLPEAT